MNTRGRLWLVGHEYPRRRVDAAVMTPGNMRADPRTEFAARRVLALEAAAGIVTREVPVAVAGGRVAAIRAADAAWLRRLAEPAP